MRRAVASILQAFLRTDRDISLRPWGRRCLADHHLRTWCPPNKPPRVKQRNGGIRGGVHRLRGDALQVFLGLRLLIHLTNELRRRSRAIFLQIPAEIEIPLHEIRVALKDKKLIYKYQGWHAISAELIDVGQDVIHPQ